ncbi:MAG: sialidase family protein [Candidatus Poribacteria bacterium]|nr:sialidase family protein [Candidatus Poribacteria bacterium]
MIQEAIYTHDQSVLKVSVERCEVLLQSDEILNFPRIIELDGERLVLPYGCGRHGGAETRPVAISEDFGVTWTDLPPDAPMADNVQTSGILGYLQDGTIAYIDVFPVNVKWSRAEGQYHRVAKVEDPIFRIRRFSRRAELLDDSTFRVLDLPWKTASYEFYGTLLELENGDFMTAFQAQVGLPSGTRCDLTTFIARSTDGGKTFEPVWTFHPEIDGRPVGDQGFCEPDMEVLANGDILCMMRTGSGSPMYQSRSTDGGETWSEPTSIGWPGVKPHLRLLSNGVLACSAGRGVYGQPQVTYAMFSLDGTGEVWEYPFAFHTGPGCSYTSNMERDGKLYVVYSHSSFTSPADTYGLPYHAIKWAVLNTVLEE